MSALQRPRQDLHPPGAKGPANARYKTVPAPRNLRSLYAQREDITPEAMQGER